jgi:hypothetical protein
MTTLAASESEFQACCDDPRVVIYDRNRVLIHATGVFVPGRLYQPSLMSESRARAYPGEALFLCSTETFSTN